jgi:HAD superfamily phosphoserine phosphatase-like hydrolase
VTLDGTPRYRLACFDLDGTLVDDTIFIWQTLHDHFGSDATRRSQAREDFFEGRISYDAWLSHDMELLIERGANHDRLREAVGRLQPMEGAHEVLATLSAQGVRLAVLSGSLDVVLERHFPATPFAHVFLNRLRFAPDGAIAAWEATPYDLARKADGLLEMARREGLPLQRIAFVGDHENDLEVVRLLKAQGGMAVAFNCKSPALAREASVVVPGRDLRAVLPHLLQD